MYNILVYHPYSVYSVPSTIRQLERIMLALLVELCLKLLPRIRARVHRRSMCVNLYNCMHTHTIKLTPARSTASRTSCSPSGAARTSGWTRTRRCRTRSRASWPSAGCGCTRACRTAARSASAASATSSSRTARTTAAPASAACCVSTTTASGMCFVCAVLLLLE